MIKIFSCEVKKKKFFFTLINSFLLFLNFIQCSTLFIQFPREFHDRAYIVYIATTTTTTEQNFDK